VGPVPREVRLTLQAGAVLLLAVMIGLFAHSLAQDRTTVYALVKDGKTATAPDLTLPRLMGPGDASLASLRGRVVLVNFWASWCDACKSEAPLFNQELARHRAQGLRVLGVDTSDFAADGRGFARTYDQRYTLVHDSGDVTRRWGIGTGLPVTYVVDRQGKVVHLFDGVVTGNALDRVLRPLLRETA
jgi:cytochrome c biogenesis protein CcmG, thiol:disulfide interchange protein DsbE